MMTNRDGEVHLSVHEFLDVPACANAITDHYGPAVIKPGIFIATPMHDTPAVLAYTMNNTEQDLGYAYRDVFNGSFISRQSTEWDTIINVYSWNLSGESLASVYFSWVYIAEAAVRYRFV